jgi:hypothetical protein
MSLLKFLGKVITDALYVIGTEDDPYRLLFLDYKPLLQIAFHFPDIRKSLSTGQNTSGNFRSKEREDEAK